jgi:erythronate-4-phosphate dehydrogenase
MKIIADDTIPILPSYFPPPFVLEQVPIDKIAMAIKKKADVLLCRSTLRVNAQLIQNTSIKIIATATSGVDHIDQCFLQDNKIQLIDAKGCNANAVADYIIAILASLKFNANNTKAGVIGLGHVGTIVSQRLNALKMEVLENDPPKAIEDQQFKSHDLSTLYDCDLITLHTPLTFNGNHSTYHLIDKAFITKLKVGSIIINAARGGIVDEKAIIEHGSHLHYCADVFKQEPFINYSLIQRAAVTTPHIAGHSIEAKKLAPILLSKKIHKHCQLPQPPLSYPFSNQAIALPNKIDWQQLILSLYSPSQESQALKAAQNSLELKQTFQKLRSAHTFRHGFDTFKLSRIQSGCPVQSFDQLLGRA